MMCKMELGKLENQAVLSKQRSNRTACEPLYRVNAGPDNPRSNKSQLNIMFDKDCSGELDLVCHQQTSRFEVDEGSWARKIDPGNNLQTTKGKVAVKKLEIKTT
ncbi:hypothetical protein GQ457_02G023040 [Hibiscus cannabinus]